MIVVGGDFNQWPVQDIIKDFVDMTETTCGPTRGSRSIDRTFINYPYHVAGTVLPLETNNSTKKSNHKVAFTSSSIQRASPYVWLDYSYRYYNEESAVAFGQWLAGEGWGELYLAQGSNGKASVYQSKVTAALEKCFPLVTVQRKSTDPPWFNRRIRKHLKQQRSVYRREGRSSKWKRLKKITADLIAHRRSLYVLSQKDALLALSLIHI